MNILSKEPDWSNELPTHCTHCGGLLIGYPKKVTEYDSRTGKPTNRKEYYLKCERIKWWHFHTMHDEKLVIEEPNRKIGGYSYRGVLTIIRMP